jgi:hypothetical protein
MGIGAAERNPFREEISAVAPGEVSEKPPRRRIAATCTLAYLSIRTVPT